MADSKVLIAVDDDPDILKFVVVVGKHIGYEVHTAKSCEECLTLLETVKPTFILLDVDMPGKNGIQTVKLIKETYPDLHAPVVFLTAKSDMATIRQVSGIGADDYILKPVDPTRLAEKIVRTAKRAREPRD